MFLFKAVSGYGLAVIVIVLVIVNIRLNLFTFSPFTFFPFSFFPLRAVEKEVQKLKAEKEISPCTSHARVKKFQISFSEEVQQYLNSIFERRSAGQEFVDYYG